MSDQNKSWNNVNKRRKKKPYKKSYKQHSKYNSDSTSNNKKENITIMSQKDFPSLSSWNNSTNNEFMINNTFNILVWGKNSESSKKDTIYLKAKDGYTIFNSYPLLYDTPSFPLFQ